MDGIHFKASIHNLTQLDHHQEQGHRIPLEQQNINAHLHADMAHRAATMPVEPEMLKEKNVDPDDKRHEDQRRRRDRRKRSTGHTPERRRTGGHCIDLDA